MNPEDWNESDPPPDRAWDLFAVALILLAVVVAALAFPLAVGR